jgi:hypothetical protein
MLKLKFSATGSTTSLSERRTAPTTAKMTATARK